MSSDEENAAIARIVRDRTEARRKHALLQSELASGGKTLRELADALLFLGSSGGAGNEYLMSLIGRHSDLLLPSKLGQMLKEYTELDASIKNLDELAKKAGID